VAGGVIIKIARVFYTKSLVLGGGGGRDNNPRYSAVTGFGYPQHIARRRAAE
jgi:hypothetical protein